MAILIGVGGLFILTETGFRIAGIPRQSVSYDPAQKSKALTIFRPDPELGWAYVPDTAVRMQFGPPRWVNVFFDENGIRVPSDQFYLDPSKPSILFIGCSYTMGQALFFEETFPGKIASLPEFPLQVVNLGVQAYGTDQSLMVLEKFIARFNTKMVVYTFIDEHVGRNVRNKHKSVFFKLQGDELVRQNAVSSRKFPWYASRVLESIRVMLDVKLGWFLNSKELTRKLIMKMKEVSEAHGARFAVIHWMWNDREDSKDLFEGMDLEVISTLDEAPSGWGKMKNAYDGHPTPDADTHVAQLLIKYLAKNAFKETV